MNPGLSVIIPAFNEANRIPRFLGKVRDYLPSAFGEDFEVIVVDDGSIDGTADEVARIASGWPQLRMLTHAVNRGKGAAVRSGMLASAARLILFADADGATPIEEEARLRAEIEAGADLAVGSRLLSTSGGNPHRPWHREVAGKLFAMIGRTVVGVSQSDTQCGFKMFRGDVGRRLFMTCEVDGYLFDLYVLAMAERFGLRVAEVAVRWSDQPDSKIHLMRDSIGMLAGLWRLRSRVRLDARRGATAPVVSPVRIF